MATLLSGLALFAGSALLSAGLLPLWRRWCRRIGLVDHPGQRKLQVEPIPLAGGLALLSALGIASGALAAAAHGRLPGPQLGLLAPFIEHPADFWWLLAGAAGMTCVGWIDDRKELRPALKFLGQVGVAGAVSAAGMGTIDGLPHSIWGAALAVLWIVTVTNALNFIDNMNGLCAGLGVIAAAGFGSHGVVQGDWLSAALGFLTAGVAAGFLPWNFPRARAFLGDAGSHLLGYLLAILALLAHHQAGGGWIWRSVAAALLPVAVPLADLAWVVLLRSSAGKPFYVGDTNHLSHQLVRLGLAPPQAVAVLWLTAALFGAAAAFLFHALPH